MTHRAIGLRKLHYCRLVLRKNRIDDVEHKLGNLLVLEARYHWQSLQLLLQGSLCHWNRARVTRGGRGDDLSPGTDMGATSSSFLFLPSRSDPGYHQQLLRQEKKVKSVTVVTLQQMDGRGYDLNPGTDIRVTCSSFLSVIPDIISSSSNKEKENKAFTITNTYDNYIYILNLSKINVSRRMTVKKKTGM